MFLRLRRGTLNGGANILTLSGNGAAATNQGAFDGLMCGCNYHIRNPQHDIDRLRNTLVAGDNITAIRDLNVVETCEVLVDDTNINNVLLLTKHFQRMFLQAQEHQEKGIRDRIYIEYDPDGDDDSAVSRSELLEGRIEFNTPITGQIESGMLELTLVWERRPWWEATEEQVILYQDPDIPEVSATSGAITIVNHSDEDAGDNNYVDIAFFSSDLITLPSPLRIEITNTDASGKLSRVYIGYNSTSGGEDFPHILEAEDRISATGTITIPDEADNPASGSTQQDSEQGTLSYPGGAPLVRFGDTGQDFSDWETTVAPAAYKIVIINTDATVTWGYIETTIAGSSNTQMWAFTDRDLTTLGFNGVSPTGKTPSSYWVLDVGSYLLFTWAPATAYEETLMATWSLSSALMDYAIGHPFRVLGFFWEKPEDSDFQVRMRVETPDPITLWTGEWVTLNANHAIQDLGIIPIPPRMRGLSGLRELNLTLDVKHETTASHTLKLDYLQLTALDGWRSLVPEQSGDGILQNYQLIDDGIEHLDVYAVDASNKKYALQVGLGRPIMRDALPLGTERIYFMLEAAASGDTRIDRTADVKIYIRHRFTFPQ